MNSKKILIIRFITAVSLAGTLLMKTDSLAGQMGGFDVEVGDGYYIWSEEQWSNDYYQQWNYTEDNTQENWNNAEDNIQQNWENTWENTQQSWSGEEEYTQQNWDAPEVNTQQNWNAPEVNTQQNWNAPEVNTQQNEDGTNVNTQQNLGDTWNNTQQNWNSSAGNSSSVQYGWNNPSDHMNSNSSQPYQENEPRGYWPQSQPPKPSKAPVQTQTPTVTPEPVRTATPVPTRIPTNIPSDTQKEQHLPDAVVVFGHKRKIGEGEYPSIILKSSGSVQILSFRINDRESPWRWENNRIIADTQVKKGEYQIELLVLSQGGKMVYMDPWKFSA